MQHPTESTPSDGNESVSEVVEAFEVGQAIERHRTDETIAALRRIQKRLDDAERDRRAAYAQGYVDSADGLAPDLLYGPRQTDRHDARRFGHGNGGHDVWCSCGWKSELHRKALQAVVEWREHAGLEPIRPDLHPIWCDEIHEQTACEVHVGSFGLLPLGDGALVTAMLDDSGPSNGLVATVTTLVGDNAVEHRVALERARRKQHAFTVERTRGDHFVWSCRCGHVIVQDPKDTDIHQTLIEHAGGKR